MLKAIKLRINELLKGLDLIRQADIDLIDEILIKEEKGLDFWYTLSISVTNFAFKVLRTFYLSLF